ncbi:MAG: NAD-binding protein [Betaproteobacteria bacterium]|nr:NAD-binding protein [Betaproteobacteria bacterium]MBI2224592.1 NAD-binding protein [Betaproteobacteria bacterium]MBI2289366.1 NAD-binding protein [Betaproteobacteria bacterium]
MTFNVGVIGLGIIGKPIAERLVKAGFRVAVHDVRDEPVAELKNAGATACASSAEVAGRSDIIISLVLDRAQTNDVVFGEKGVIQTIRPGTLFATGSTLGPAPVRSIAAALAAKGCMTLDMPITGGYPAAYEGKLVLMIGGAQDALERALPVFRAFANNILRVGDIGAGQVAKLAHQLVMSVNVIALLEGLSLGVAGGVEPAILKQIFRDGLANSGVLQVWDGLGPRYKSMLKPAPPGASLPNLRKDLHSALELAHELGVTSYLGTQASLIADAGVATGHDNPLL